MKLASSADAYRTLYYEWEAARWQVAELDFEQDRVDVDGLSWSRSLIAHITTMKSILEVVPEVVVDLADAAPHEEQQVFLTTQLADAARELVLFDRFLTEVGESGGAPPPAADEIAATLRRSVEGLEIGATAALARAVVQVCVAFEGVVVGSWQDMLRAALESERALPGLVEGLRRTIADHERHARFGVELARAFEDGAAAASAIVGGIVDVIAAAPSLFDGRHFAAEELRASADRALERLLA